MSDAEYKYSAYHYSATKIESQCSSRLAPKNTTLQVATGFFFADKGRVFLITNRHIVIREDRDWYPDSLRFYYHIDKKDPRKIQYCSFPLYDENQKKLWLEHPDNNPDVKNGIVDVVAIDISEIKENLDSNFLWMKAHIVAFPEPRFDTPLSLLGFPLGFYDNKNHLPVTRGGYLASVYNINFKDRHRFLVDIYTHPGSSGGPVFSQFGSSNIISGSLLGVFSGTTRNEYRDLRLGYVWYARLIPEIIDHNLS